MVRTLLPYPSGKRLLPDRTAALLSRDRARGAARVRRVVEHCDDRRAARLGGCLGRRRPDERRDRVRPQRRVVAAARLGKDSAKCAKPRAAACGGGGGIGGGAAAAAGARGRPGSAAARVGASSAQSALLERRDAQRAAAAQQQQQQQQQAAAAAYAGSGSPSGGKVHADGRRPPAEDSGLMPWEW
eukprot:3206645-Prymnesium_polylepis.1